MRNKYILLNSRSPLPPYMYICTRTCTWSRLLPRVKIYKYLQKSSIFSGYPGPTYADRKTGTSRCQKSNLQIHIFRGKKNEKKYYFFHDEILFWKFEIEKCWQFLRFFEKKMIFFEIFLKKIKICKICPFWRILHVYVDLIKINLVYWTNWTSCRP